MKTMYEFSEFKIIVNLDNKFLQRRKVGRKLEDKWVESAHRATLFANSKTPQIMKKIKSPCWAVSVGDAYREHYRNVYRIKDDISKGIRSPSVVNGPYNTRRHT